GRLADAEACYDEVTELTEAVGQDPALFKLMDAQLLAWQGKGDEARATVRAAIAATAAAGFDVYEYTGMEALTTLELGAGNYEAVRATVQRSYDDDMVIFGNRALPHVIEAAARLGDDDVAQEALERLRARTMAAGTSWGLGLLARSCALVADDDHAESY